MDKSHIKFGNHVIGGDARTFIIAEAGSNHNGDLGLAKKLIDEAAKAGADAIKFQTFRAESHYVRHSGSAEYLDDNRSLFEILESLEMPYEWIPELAAYADRQNIIFLSTPSDIESARRLQQFVPLFKVESFNLSNYPFLKQLSHIGKPLIVSTGAHEMGEIRDAMEQLRDLDMSSKCVILHCVSLYPTPIDSINLRVLQTLIEEYDVPVGLSDHTMDPVVAPVAAVALGSSVIEKHFTLNRQMNGPDHNFALEPRELEKMITKIRATEQALGDGNKLISCAEQKMGAMVRRYVHAKENISKGEKLEKHNIALLSPGRQEPGLEPKYYDDILGSVAANDIKQSSGITWNDIAQ